MQSRWNQEMTPYKVFRKIIEFGVMCEPHLGTFHIHKIETFLRRC